MRVCICRIAAFMIGGKDKTKIRNATPIEFRDQLIAMTRTARF